MVEDSTPGTVFGTIFLEVRRHNLPGSSVISIIMVKMPELKIRESKSRLTH